MGGSVIGMGGSALEVWVATGESEGWVIKLVARLLVIHCIRLDTDSDISQKNKCAAQAKEGERPTNSSQRDKL